MQLHSFCKILNRVCATVHNECKNFVKCQLRRGDFIQYNMCCAVSGGPAVFLERRANTHRFRPAGCLLTSDGHGAASLQLGVRGLAQGHTSSHIKVVTWKALLWVCNWGKKMANRKPQTWVYSWHPCCANAKLKWFLPVELNVRYVFSGKMVTPQNVSRLKHILTRRFTFLPCLLCL